MGDTSAGFTLAPLVVGLPRDLVIVGEEPVVLVGLGVVEQRYRAVLEVLEGAPVVEVARRNGVTRQTVHEWLRRYANDGGLGGLADRSSRPVSCPHQMSPVVEAMVVAMRRAYPGWGPDRIGWQLARDGVDPLPGRSSVYRALVRHGLVEARKRRRRREDYRRWERARSMELWQMDVMGRLYLSDGRECKVVTGIDDHSRFVVCAKIVGRATARPVCGALVEALRRHGIPEQVLTDIQSWWALLSPVHRPVDEDRQRPAPARRRCLTDRSATRLLAC